MICARYMTFAAAAVMALTMSLPAQAALKAGDKAPDFTLQAARNGVVGRFSLTETLKTGPVVVYFYPKAFTTGCSIEAHEFSEAVTDFKALGVTVIGVSADDLPTLMEFSKKDCQGRFPVASDAKATVAQSYDAKIPDAVMASRISYLIMPDRTIAEVTDSSDAHVHVKAMLAAAKVHKAS